MPTGGGKGMSTLALNIRMHGKLAVIIGGGVVALRKIRTLLAAGAAIRVVAVNSCPDIVDMNSSGIIDIKHGHYDASDLDGAFLVIAATDDFQVNQQVCADARAQSILVSVADNPGAGDCTFPALLKQGDLEIAVSTGGRCPTFAVDVRNYIAKHIGQEYGVILEQLSLEREKLLTNGSSSTYNTRVLRSRAVDLLAELTERKDMLP